MAAGTILYYSNMATPDVWTEEVARIGLKILDSLVGRIRSLEVLISDPRNVKESIYTPYLRIKVVERTSNSTIFLGRVELADPYYDEQYGEVLKITCADYLRELFERKLNSNYSALARKRSALISQIITDYAYTGTLTQNIEESGSADTIARNYTNCDKTLIQVIEELAQEDFWTDETWGAAWRFNNVTYDDNTTEVNSGAGTPFNFLGASNHYFYLGQATNPFLGAEFDLQVMGSYGTQTWSYWNGSTWSPLTISLAYDFTADGTIRWDLPTDWAKVAFSNLFPHSAVPPDTTSRYWVRVSVASVTTTATVNQIKCVRGCGYDYYVDDSQVFQYFRRGSKPAGGASANGLTIALNEAEAQSVRAMYYDYSICDQPKEIITRVTVKGKNIIGADQSFTATRSDLETTYKIVKEKVDYVWGADMTSGALYSYGDNRAKALLGIQAGDILRGKCRIVRYPYFGAGKTLVRVGDLIHIHCSPKSINEDFLVLEVNYEEPPGMATIKFITTVYGRAYSPFELTSVLQGLRSGQDISVSTARIQDLIVNDARITTCSITKLTAGNLTVTGTITTGSLITAAAGARITFDSIGLKVYDATTQRGQILTDGSGWFGSSGIFSWTTAGVLTMEAANVSGALTAATIGVDKLTAGNLTAIGTITTGSLITAAAGARTTLDSTGFKVYDATTQRGQILSNGSGWFGSSGTFSWTTAGVLTIAAANVSGALTAATISGDSISGGTITGVVFSQAAGAVIIGATGLKVYGQVFYCYSETGGYAGALASLDALQGTVLSASGRLRLLSSSGGVQLMPAAGQLIELSGALAAQNTYTNHLCDIHPYNVTSWLGSGSEKWAFIFCNSLGADGFKVTDIWRTNEHACPLPTSNSALDVIRKIKDPIIAVGDYGKRHYFQVENFPDEMKHTPERKELKDGSFVGGKPDIELTRVTGILVQAIRELTKKVEVLEVK